jgi:para-nitrobenzyl esterase
MLADSSKQGQESPPTSTRTWTARRRFGIALVTAGVLAAGLAACGSNGVAARSAGSSQHQPIGLVVAIANGAVKGKAVAATDEWLGIPYAAPPVGKLRWKAPQAAAPWKGVRDATHFAPHCAQPASDFGVASMSENCLYLNVYTPGGTTRGQALPVIVWIHGGAFVWGESDDYNPARLVSHGVIVVTINYRLGALGFLAESALASHPGGPSGNYGLMDQQAALRWVQKNIAKFGGSPNNVTLSGESSGGMSVLVQLASSGAHGLFSKAIVESGAYDLRPESRATAEVAGRAFAVATGCTSQTAACLRKLPIKTILADEAQAGYRPDIDGQVLTKSLATSFATGQFNRVPVVDGSNHNEYRLFVALYQLFGDPVTAAAYQERIAGAMHVSASVAASIAGKYPLKEYPSPALALGAVVTDGEFACPALSVDQSVSKYVPTYAYEFNDENAPERYLAPVNFAYGAAHESEVQYLFDVTNTRNPGVLTASQQQLALAMTLDWTEFAKDGSPSSSHGVRWPAFESASHQLLSLIPPRPQVETDFAAAHNCAFWVHAG